MGFTTCNSICLRFGYPPSGFLPIGQLQEAMYAWSLDRKRYLDGLSDLLEGCHYVQIMLGFCIVCVNLCMVCEWIMYGLCAGLSAEYVWTMHGLCLDMYG